jgi:hypothetical protein
MAQGAPKEQILLVITGPSLDTGFAHYKIFAQVLD